MNLRSISATIPSTVTRIDPVASLVENPGSRTYNARRQRVLGGLSPDEAVRRRIQAVPKLASERYEPPPDTCIRSKALLVVEAAKEVSHTARRFLAQAGDGSPAGNELRCWRAAAAGWNTEP